MASTLKHLRSSTANKRPTASGIADGQIAINTASGTPALFFKDNADNIVKVGPVHVGATAPNASPAGSAGNSTGELWVDNSLTTQGLKYYSGSEFINLTPSGTTSAAGLVELATNAETQAGSDAVRAVTPAGLQSKVSDSTSTTSSTTIASATAVKSAYDLANAALPKSGGTVTGEIVISPSGSLAFEGSTDDSFETRIVVTDPTADRTITLPNTTGTVITTGDSGTVTSTMIADGAIVDADINASAAIAPSKLGSGALPNGVTVSSTNIVNGTIVDADVNASAAIAGTKISPNFGGQNIVTTGSVTGASLIPSSATVPTNGLYLPATNSVALSTNGTGRLFVGSTGNVGIGTTSPSNSLTVVGDGIAINDTAPRLRFIESDGTSTHNRTDVFQSIDGFYIETKDNAGTFKGIDYQIQKGASGATAHLWYIDGTERARIDSSGRLLAGTSTSTALLGYNSGVQFATADGTFSAIRNSANTGSPEFVSAKSRGSVGSPAIVLDGDGLWLGRFAGYDGTSYVEAARISAVVDGTPGANDMPGMLVFSTTADGASSPTERMRIKANGRINFSGVPVYADNTAALAGGLAAGDVYRKSDGTLMITY